MADQSDTAGLTLRAVTVEQPIAPPLVLINSAEDFIQRAATASSLSGVAYEVKYRGAEIVTSSHWLRNLLARYRAAHRELTSLLR